MTIGEKIALRRRTAGLSQEALTAQLGVSRQAVSRWETDESLPDTEKIAQLCRIFGVSADDLLLDKPPETSASVRPPTPSAVPAVVLACIPGSGFHRSAAGPDRAGWGPLRCGDRYLVVYRYGPLWRRPDEYQIRRHSAGRASSAADCFVPASV